MPLPSWLFFCFVRKLVGMADVYVHFSLFLSLVMHLVIDLWAGASFAAAALKYAQHISYCLC
jgi:hypothetical protein